MSDKDKFALIGLLRGLSAGSGFVIAIGFAIGWHGLAWLIALGLAVVSAGSLYLSFRLNNLD